MRRMGEAEKDVGRVVVFHAGPGIGAIRTRRRN